MRVADAVGRALAELGADRVFGVVGSGNFHVTNAVIAGGARFTAARHEGGAATMADAYARTSGRLAVLTVHQGCGLTNALTGITEAAKSRTPMIVLAAEATSPRSNFHVDQAALAESVGAAAHRVTAEHAVADVTRAVTRAVHERRTVVLNLPLDVQAAETTYTTPSPPRPTRQQPGNVAALESALAQARRPVFIAGRGARHARKAMEQLANRCGALLATSAVGHGLFTNNPWSLGISGGFASPLTAELIANADLVVGWGCALNMWTTRHQTLISKGTTVVQVDLDDEALGLHRPIDIGVTGDVATVADAIDVPESQGYRTPELETRIAKSARWRDVPYTDESEEDRIDPRTLTILLDDLLPAERVIGVDSGNFMGYPSAYLSVPDERGFCFTQAFQSIGLGLATTIGAALAQPDRLPVAALGDGGGLMGIAELDTVRRLGLPMVIVCYNDDGYGAEFHHFGPEGDPQDTVRFPDTDIAAIGRGFGCTAITVRRAADLVGFEHWRDGPRDTPVLIDAKVTNRHGSWWLEEAFRGH